MVCFAFFLIQSPQTKKKSEEENVLETIQEKDVLSKVAVFSWRNCCCCAGRGGGSHQFLHVPCSLLPPVSASFSLRCDPGLVWWCQAGPLWNAGCCCCGIEPCRAPRKLFPERSLETGWRGCNGVMMAVLRVSWQWALIWNSFGSSLGLPDGRCVSCRTSMTRRRSCSCFALLGPALGRAECAPVLLGVAGLGALQRTGLFCLVCLWLLWAKNRKGQKTEDNFLGYFFFNFFLRAKLGSKYMFIGMWWKLCTGREELLWEMSSWRNAWGGHSPNSLLWWVHVLPSVTFTDLLVQEAKQLGFLQDMCQSFPHRYVLAVASFVLIRNHSYYLIFLYSYFCTLP